MLKLLISCLLLTGAPVTAADARELRIMVIFAHPDEGEIYVGGTAALYAKMGHRVKFLSLTNGDAGHFSMKPEDLAKRRYKEAMAAKETLGLAEYEVLDYHDGKLQDTPEVREKVVVRIQEFKPDVVFTYYPAIGGHRDNMTAGWIVRGAAPSVNLETKPVYFYVRDFFTSRLTYVPHVAVDIDSVWEAKLKACGAHESQVIEANPYRQGMYEQVKASKELQRKFLFNNTYAFSHITPDNYLTLQKWYGPEAAKKVNYVEAFEVAEFGRQIREEDVRGLMPMVGNLLTVPGKTQWADTGIDLTKGRPVEITAEGMIQWKEDGNEMCGPRGAVTYSRGGHRPLLGVNVGALIGKIGADSTDYFYIGAGQSIRPFAAGRLFVGINDDNVSDNAGAYRVWIRMTGNN